MKIYGNKLYAIPDVAKRGGVTEDQIKEMITYHVIMAYRYTSGVYSIWGKDIPYLKANWAEWEAKKGKMKKVDVTMLFNEDVRNND